MNKALLYGIIAAGVVVFMAYLFIVRPAGANQGQCNANNPTNCPIPSPICDNGEHVGNPHCITPTPTITECEDCVTPTPTVVQEETPTATPSATLTPEIPPAGHGDGLNDGKSSCPECTQAPKDYRSPFDGQPAGWK